MICLKFLETHDYLFSPKGRWSFVVLSMGIITGSCAKDQIDGDQMTTEQRMESSLLDFLAMIS